jgi:hypothetical protein
LVFSFWSIGVLILDYTVQDIGGPNVKTWLGLVHSLGLAAVAPFAGAVSDLIGRRYPAIFGTILIIIGMVVVGTAHEMNVAIGGQAVAGVGAGICQTIGISGIAELVPVNQRGRYIGTVFMLFSPMAAANAYGIPTRLLVTDYSAHVFGLRNVEMGRLDSIDLCRRWTRHDSCSISSPSSLKLHRPDSISSHCSNRLYRRNSVNQWTRTVDGRPSNGRLQ